MTDWDVLGVLAEPQRRAVYRWVCGAEGTVTREQVAEGVHISRALAAFHLDRLVEAELLDATVEPAEPRRAGRPAKRYRRSSHDVQLTWPPRHYELVARVLVEAVASSRDGADARSRARRVSRREGERASENLPAESCVAVLEHLGYVPADCGSHIELRNCPFDGVVDAAPELVCGMNLAFLKGLLAERGEGGVATLDPAAGRCCVLVTP